MSNEFNSGLLNILLDAELPAQILSRRFDQYLFFDVDISSSKSMILAVEDILGECFGLDLETEIYKSSSRELIARISSKEEWCASILRAGKAIRNDGDFGGLILLDSKIRWIVYQSRPVDMGIFAINNKIVSGKINNIKEDFFDIADISGWLARRTARDNDLVQGFGADFLEKLVNNYQ